MEATPAAWLRMPARADRRAGLRLKVTGKLSLCHIRSEQWINIQ